MSPKTTDKTPQDGIEVLKKRLKLLPTGPGVYRMLDEAGAVLYVGKAKNIKARVTQYTQPERMPKRIRRMVFETRDLMVVEAASEADALLLEASLIKSLKPKYNILMRDDSSYPGIWLTPADKTPTRLTTVRGRPPKTGHYFGPYPSAQAAYHTVDLVERVFQLRTCSDGFYKSRSRPCLKYHIKRCTAPCAGRVAADDYQKQVSEAADFLAGKGQQVQSHLKQRMVKLAASERFEEAATLRDRLAALAQVLTQQTTVAKGLSAADVVCMATKGPKVCVQIFAYRTGVHVGNAQYFPQVPDADMPPADIMRQFLALHYTGAREKQTPRLILTNTLPDDAEALAEALARGAGHAVHIESPARGEKAQLVKQAYLNALGALARKLSERQSQAETLEELRTLLGREEAISRIECFDISNTQGTNPVASMVVADETGMAKDQYRKFAIKSKTTPDDYAMMREALMRRYSRLQKEGGSWPDVVMVDGGTGHLNVLIDVFKTLGIEGGPTLCAIAKGPERDKGLEKIFTPTAPAPLPIPFGSTLIFLLQRIRDEAHRTAIGYHRQVRSKKLTKSILDQIPGIGPRRKKDLLLHFGSPDGVKNATVADLEKVPGISTATAQLIYDFFHG